MLAISSSPLSLISNGRSKHVRPKQACVTERSLLCDADKIRIPPPDRRSATSLRPTPTRPFGDVDQSTPIEHMQLELNKRASRTSRLKRAEDNS